jgi:hypothetical protein
VCVRVCVCVCVCSAGVQREVCMVVLCARMHVCMFMCSGKLTMTSALNHYTMCATAI